MEREERRTVSLAVYGEVCRSYERIDDFRAKLLALLPGVSGALLVLLVGQDGLAAGDSENPDLLAAAGVFGAIVTVGLLCYEERGFQRCVRLVSVGRQLETDMGVEGRFRSWPHSLWRTIHEPFASGLVYSAVFSGWLYVALLGWHPDGATIWAGVGFIVGVIATDAFYWWVTWVEELPRTKRRTQSWPFLWFDWHDKHLLKRRCRRFRKKLDAGDTAIKAVLQQACAVEKQISLPHDQRDYECIRNQVDAVWRELACAGEATSAFPPKTRRQAEAEWGRVEARLRRRWINRPWQ